MLDSKIFMIKNINTFTTHHKTTGVRNCLYILYRTFIYDTAVRAVLYLILRFIKCPGTFKIRIGFENEKKHFINKIIEQIIVSSQNFKYSFQICEKKFQSWAIFAIHSDVTSRF